MGSHVITGIRVNVVPAPAMPNGYGYWIIETGYDKKDGPKEESSCVMAIGDRNEILKRLFLMASSFPGGMLQIRSGYASPSHMLRGWIKQLDNPYLSSTLNVRLGNSPDGFYDAITDQTREGVAEIFARFGYAEQSQKILAGETLHVDLAEYFPVLWEMNTRLKAEFEVKDGKEVQKFINSWRILPNRFCPNGGEKISIPTTTASITCEEFEFLKAEFVGDPEPFYFQKLGDGKTQNCNAKYEWEANFLSNAWKAEASQPGHFAKSWKSFQDAFSSARTISNDSQFTVTKVGQSEWAVKEICKDQVKLFGNDETDQFTVSLSRAHEVLGHFRLRYLLARNCCLTEVYEDAACDMHVNASSCIQETLF